MKKDFENYEIAKYVLLEALRENYANKVKKWVEILDKQYSWICKAWFVYKDKNYDEDWLKEVGTDYNDIKIRTEDYLSEEVTSLENLSSANKKAEKKIDEVEKKNEEFVPKFGLSVSSREFVPEQDESAQEEAMMKEELAKPTVDSLSLGLKDNMDVHAEVLEGEIKPQAKKGEEEFPVTRRCL